MTMATGLMGPGVKAQCRVCGNFAVADQFKLHYQLRQMVCPGCFSGKNQKEKEQKVAEKVQEPMHPPGWDKEDEYLEKVARMRKQEQQPQFARISGSDFVRYTCMGCKYNFKYDPQARIPRSCPYCNVEVPRMKASNLI